MITMPTFRIARPVGARRIIPECHTPDERQGGQRPYQRAFREFQHPTPPSCSSHEAVQPITTNPSFPRPVYISAPCRGPLTQHLEERYLRRQTRRGLPVATPRPERLFWRVDGDRKLLKRHWPASSGAFRS